MSSRSTIGMCWGDTLRHMAAALTPQRYPNAQVVQIIGGLGQPDAEVHATELCRSVSRSLGCRLTLAAGARASWPTSARARRCCPTSTCSAPWRPSMTSTSPSSASAHPRLDSVTMRDGSIITRGELDGLLRKGAVGDIALRYYDANGECIESDINERIIGMTLEQIKQVPRIVGVSGGPDKLAAIRAALRGRLINVLITDSVTAERLLEDADG